MAFSTLNSFHSSRRNIINIPVIKPFISYPFDNSLIFNAATGISDATISGVAALDNTDYQIGSGSVKFTGTGTGNNSIISNNFTVNPTGYTFSCWFKVPPGILKGFQTIFCTNGASSGFQFTQDYSSSNPNCMNFYAVSSGPVVEQLNIFYPTPVFDNTWHHTVITISSDGLTVLWYLDGVQITYTTRTKNTNTYAKEITNLQVGCINGLSGTFHVDEFRFYNQPLSTSDAKRLYTLRSGF
jgi:hypothetical protein